ncbi:hypothetical protein LZZ85_21980 [Terrimonas sp. NA20]|uniref:Uncharacterized protein n=1 Tax=Terrimonas ginsenosidimutans TaxID=2908004 RepID=A0ABS9KXL2_9BACT|nr:hypothetical protein [Terrimonas ginsenosidimutans]MCG2616982.1 hypothetical protein [Terrimonas ginsenosidimutans]
MANKKQYYGLDNIGFIGTQDRSKAQIKKDLEDTAKYIKAKKDGKVVSRPSKPRLSKAK